VAPLWQNSSVLVVILAGGFTTNFIWCVILNLRNKTGGNYTDARTPLLRNYFFAALAGITWYLQFMFYGMGTTQMGLYDFSSWTLHMAFIIIVSNFWGLYFKEWHGSSSRTMRIFRVGILVVIFSTIIVGVGNYLAAKGF
jgi:L-rhamnose-H+ transport protein